MLSNLSPQVSHHRPRQLFGLVGLLFIGLVVFSFNVEPTVDQSGRLVINSATAKALVSKSWKFDHERDSNNYGLNAWQCSTAFPSLYQAIEKTINSLNGTRITYEDTVGGNHWSETRVMLYGNQVR